MKCFTVWLTCILSISAVTSGFAQGGTLLPPGSAGGISNSLRKSFESQSWNGQFKNELQAATALYKDAGKIDKSRLYELGRAYIRKKLEALHRAIEETKLATTSDHIVLKQMYELFDYCNPRGLSFGDDVPGFHPHPKYNDVLYQRWKGLYEQGLSDAKNMYDYGDKLYGPQVYELGRALFLVKFHSEGPTLEDEDISGEQWIVMRSVFHVISYLNAPGGPNLGYAPDFKQKESRRQQKKYKWATVEKILKDNKGVLGIGNGLIAFGVGSPSSWQVLSERLPEGEKLEDATAAFATAANRALTRAAAAYTDIGNKDVNSRDQTRLFSNYVSGDDYAPFLPPSVRVHFIKHVGTPTEPIPESLAFNMVGFEKNARIYGLAGWQGIGQKYLNEFKRDGLRDKKEKPTLRDFEDYLLGHYILLEKVDWGNQEDDLLEDYLKDTSGEARLGALFSKGSIFSVW